MPLFKKIIVTWSMLMVAALVLLGIIFWWLLSPMDRQETSLHNITVPKGASVASIATQLQDDGIVRSALLLRLELRGKDSQTIIQTGTYSLSPSMSIAQVADALLKGPKDQWVTLLEGWRREEMADELERVFGMRYFHRDDFLNLTKDKEGMLFPDTYLFPKEATAQLIVSALEDNFNKKYQKLVSQLGQGPLPDGQNLILASILVKEAKTEKDMKLVAGVLLNRISLGMPLQSDVTVQYFRGYDAKEKTWWPTPKASDKLLDTPYNTYAHKGLPPTPICDPGADAISAALSPTKSDYIFYLADNSGVVHYARTLEEHNANIQKYLK